MTTLREAAQQALEALETCDAAHPSDGGQQWYDEKLVEPAITALRAALAESGRDWSLLEATQESLREHMAEIQRLRAALAQQAEPVQEPFGYLWPTGRHPEFRFTQQKRDGADGMPLYTASPQRKPLTEEEIERIARDCLDAWSCTRAVEAAHGIKAVEDGK